MKLFKKTFDDYVYDGVPQAILIVIIFLLLLYVAVVAPASAG